MATIIDGIITTDFGGNDISRSITVQADGRIVLAGSIGMNSFALARYNTNGSLDNSFDGDGKVITNFPSGSAEGHDVALDANGNILVAGKSYSNNSYNFTVTRYLSDGSLDSNFDGDGIVSTDFGWDDSANSIAIQPNGKILVAGYSMISNYEFSLARYNTDGSLDYSLGGNGKIAMPISFDSNAYSVTVQFNEKILVAGYDSTNRAFALIRFNSDGSLDNSFGDGTVVVLTKIHQNYDYAYSVALQTDNKILVAGYGSNGTSNGETGADFTLVRYDSNGNLDNSFGDGDGVVITDFVGNGTYDYADSLVVQPDGKIIVAGTSNGSFALTRYDINGNLDTSFDGDGKVITTVSGMSIFNGGGNQHCSVALQSDGKILVTGASSTGDFVLVRYNTDGSLDTSFNGTDNQIPTGSITINDPTPKQNQTLTVSNTLADADGLGDITYTWFADGLNLGTGNNYTVTANDIGKAIKVIASYTDGKGKAESVDSNITNPVTEATVAKYNGNSYFLSHAGTWTDTQAEAQSVGGNLVTINDQAEQDFLTTTFLENQQLWIGLTDQEIEGTFKWISGENSTYSNWGVGEPNNAGGNENYAHLWTDSKWNDLPNSSAMQGIIEINNRAPTGAVVINDTTPTENQLLSGSNNLIDTDGLGEISYTWLANDLIVGSGNNYTVTANDIGKAIQVTARYTDGWGRAESVSSAATTTVTPLIAAGVIINPVGKTSTGEDGTSVSYTVTLKTAPSQDVTINFASSDTTEGMIDQPTLVFTATNYATAQTLTVRGVDDSILDGNVAYSITAKISSLDPSYNALTVKALKLLNTDDGKDSNALTLYGDLNGSKNDVLTGKTGADTLYGLTLADNLSGGAGNDSLWGGEGDDSLFGGDGNDVLHGEQGDDYMEASIGNDSLDGGKGSDIMIGGSGNDTYYLGYDALDIITDNGLLTDTDTAIVPYQLKTYKLARDIENATIADGTKACRLMGNESNNVLIGNAGQNDLNGLAGQDSLSAGMGNDTLNGGTGHNALVGGAGKDSFVFNTALNTTFNKITDFKPIDDSIVLENAIFTQLEKPLDSVLNTAFFVKAKAAVDNNDYLIYNKATGALFYDADGNGSGIAVKIATLGVNLNLTHSDFIVT